MNRYPFKSRAKLKRKLQQDHNIIATKNSLRIINDYSYYALVNGYQRVLRKNDSSEEFIDGISIDQLELINLSENDIEHTLLAAIIDIERHLKNGVQYVVSRYISTMDSEYLNPHYYVSRNRTDKIQVLKKLSIIATGHDLSGRFARHMPRPSNSLEHYRHLNQIPPWILVNELSFGETIKWFRILPPKLRESVIRISFINIKNNKEVTKPFMEDHEQFFSVSLEILRQYRNGFAHDSIINQINTSQRLEFNQITNYFNSPKILTHEEFNREFGQNDLLALMILLKIYCSEPVLALTISRITNLLKTLSSSFNGINDPIIRKVFKIPDNFNNRIKAIYETNW